ncbi:uncharacterized protein LOC135804481 [Sycon ciliatum]|uniref:uncharacterized protein LOC135804481 n=1 Tax=Sycon ciliatum TaxID=27933 RepID=UPI0031F6BBB0
MRSLLVVFAFLCWSLVATGGEGKKTPVGHKMKLGSHRPMEGRVETIDYVPHPIDFYEEYSVGSKPVVLKGAARDMPAFKFWTDNYMKNNYGGETVAVEPGKKENRTRVALEGSEMNFGEFLDSYNSSDVYMVDSLPKPMEQEFMLLHNVLCGGYTKFVSMTNVWFSSGGTKSVLHNDDADNINCVLSGNKEFFMAHKKYETVVPFTKGGHVDIDVDAVDLIKTPEIRKVKWWLAEIEAGDCLFIPHYWLHQVRSTGRNLAVNIWWHFFRNFNYTECMTRDENGLEVRKDLPQYKPFSGVTIHEGESHRKRLVDVMYPTNAHKPRKLTKKQVMAAVYAGDEDEDEAEKLILQAKKAATAIFNAGNKNGDKYLDIEELYTIDADLFLELFGAPKGGYSLEDLGVKDDLVDDRRAEGEDDGGDDEGDEGEGDDDADESDSEGDEDGDRTDLASSNQARESAASKDDLDIDFERGPSEEELSQQPKDEL